MKLVDMGVMPKKRDEDYDEVKASRPEKENKPHYPNLNISSNQLPGIEMFDVGDIVTITIQGKVTSKSEGRDWYMDNDDDSTCTHMELELKKGGIDGQEKMNDIEDMKNVKSKKLSWEEDQEEEE